MESKVPPQNVEAEQWILGGLLLDHEAWDQVADVIVAGDFYKPSHQLLFEAIGHLHRSNQPVDLITITNYLSGKNQLDQVGSDFLVDLVAKTVSSANIVSYANIVKEKSLLRKVISTSTGIIEKAYSQDFNDVESFMDQVESEIYKISEDRSTQGLVSSMDIVKTSLEKIEELYHKKQEITGIPTGFTKLDQMTSGLHPGELIIIAARPSMGKTAFSLNVALNAAVKEKKSVAYFSLEMGKESLMMRSLALEAKVNMGEIRNGRIADAAWPKLIAAAGALSDAAFFIDDTSGISPFEIRARCRRLKAQHGLDLIMVDYLQLMDLKSKVESRERAVSEISKSLKSIAKELQVPVIALAQLNRGVEGRTDRRPILSDLRESGSIEQDADVIMMLYREGYYDKDNPDAADKAEVIIGKQRNGPTGGVELKWEPKFGRFRDADPVATSPIPPPPTASAHGGTHMAGGKPKNFAPGAQI